MVATLPPRGSHATFAELPTHLPPMAQAQWLAARAAAVGFDFADVAGARAKVVEEWQELQEALDLGASRAAIEGELGDVLLALVNLARHLALEPEVALAGTLARFQRRFALVEAGLAAHGGRSETADRATMAHLWEAAKAKERGSAP